MASIELLPSDIPQSMFVIGLMVLGTIWGSFVGALCDRWPRGESISRGRSRCDSCGTTLAPSELIPLLSYLMQRGRCRHCQAEIGASRFWIEVAAGSMGAAAAIMFSGSAQLVAAILFWLLLPLAILDWRHLWLPDRFVAVLAVSGLLLGGQLFDIPLNDRILGGVAGFLVLTALRIAFARLRGVEGMGAGDPKLMGAIGLWLGWQALPMLLLLASAIGLCHFLLSGKSLSNEPVQLPLGTYLCVSAAILPVAFAIV